MRSISVFFIWPICFNVSWFLHILNQLSFHMLTLKALTLLLIYLLTIPQAECLCKGLVVYNPVKKLTMGECVPVLGQKKSAAHRRVGVLQTVFWLSGKYMQDLRFAHSSGKLGFEPHFEMSGVHNFERPHFLSLWKENWNNHKIKPRFQYKKIKIICYSWMFFVFVFFFRLLAIIKILAVN